MTKRETLREEEFASAGSLPSSQRSGVHASSDDEQAVASLIEHLNDAPWFSPKLAQADERPSVPAYPLVPAAAGRRRPVDPSPPVTPALAKPALPAAQHHRALAEPRLTSRSVLVGAVLGTLAALGIIFVVRSVRVPIAGPDGGPRVSSANTLRGARATSPPLSPSARAPVSAARAATAELPRGAPAGLDHPLSAPQSVATAFAAAGASRPARMANQVVGVTPAGRAAGTGAKSSPPHETAAVGSSARNSREPPAIGAPGQGPPAPPWPSTLEPLEPPPPPPIAPGLGTLAEPSPQPRFEDRPRPKAHDTADPREP